MHEVFGALGEEVRVKLTRGKGAHRINDSVGAGFTGLDFKEEVMTWA
jgi:hypothetical protein